jgi:hypothetical protein
MLRIAAQKAGAQGAGWLAAGTPIHSLQIHNGKWHTHQDVNSSQFGANLSSEF